MPTILVTDDDSINRITLRLILQKAGYDVLIAENGAVALDMLRSGKQPDIILMDIEMPVMNGKETFRKLRTDEEFAQFAAIPIIALTAHSLPSDRQDVLKTGFDGLIAKPFDATELLAMLCSFPALQREEPL